MTYPSINPKTVAFFTLGCKLNYAETSTIGRDLKESGFETVGFDQAADVYVINTCSVTDQANKKCRKIISQALSQSENAFIVVTGCYAQLKPDEIAAMPGVDVVLGASEKFNIIEHLGDLNKKEKGEVHAREVETVDFFANSYSIGERTRAFLKVQDGCDYSCAFCTIPLARGKSRSDSIENVLQATKEIADQGAREIVLTGINLGDFGKGASGRNRREENFLDLIQALDNFEGADRYRISSIEPNLLTDDVIEFAASSKRFMPHFHIPLQSGSDTILRSMKRRYLSDLYESRVNKIKEVMPHCCIGVDVIVGFPGEDQDEFLKSYDLLNRLDVSYLHVFTYSERENTEALEMGNIVPWETRRERSKMLRNLSNKKRRAFYQDHLNTKRPVLLENEEEDGSIYGFTDNYIRVKVLKGMGSPNSLEDFDLLSIDRNGDVLSYDVGQAVEL